MSFFFVYTFVTMELFKQCKYGILHMEHLGWLPYLMLCKQCIPTTQNSIFMVSLLKNKFIVVYKETIPYEDETMPKSVFIFHQLILILVIKKDIPKFSSKLYKFNLTEVTTGISGKSIGRLTLLNSSSHLISCGRVNFNLECSSDKLPVYLDGNTGVLYTRYSPWKNQKYNKLLLSVSVKMANHSEITDQAVIIISWIDNYFSTVIHNATCSDINRQKYSSKDEEITNEGESKQLRREKRKQRQIDLRIYNITVENQLDADDDKFGLHLQFAPILWVKNHIQPGMEAHTGIVIEIDDTILIGLAKMVYHEKCPTHSVEMTITSYPVAVFPTDIVIVAAEVFLPIVTHNYTLNKAPKVILETPDPEMKNPMVNYYTTVLALITWFEDIVYSPVNIDFHLSTSDSELIEQKFVSLGKGIKTVVPVNTEMSIKSLESSKKSSEVQVFSPAILDTGLLIFTGKCQFNVVNNTAQVTIGEYQFEGRQHEMDGFTKSEATSINIMVPLYISPRVSSPIDFKFVLNYGNSTLKSQFNFNIGETQNFSLMPETIDSLARRPGEITKFVFDIQVPKFSKLPNCSLTFSSGSRSTDNESQYTILSVEFDNGRNLLALQTEKVKVVYASEFSDGQQDLLSVYFGNLVNLGSFGGRYSTSFKVTIKLRISDSKSVIDGSTLKFEMLAKFGNMIETCEVFQPIRIDGKERPLILMDLQEVDKHKQILMNTFNVGEAYEFKLQEFENLGYVMKVFID
ncbi:unnamed protein product [Heterobilharzia americana]|nr:unnamed protein product [Heterobilharzia americana]